MEENTQKNVDNQTENLSKSLENEKKEIVVNINRKYIKIVILSILFSIFTVTLLTLITIHIEPVYSGIGYAYGENRIRDFDVTSIFGHYGWQLSTIFNFDLNYDPISTEMYNDNKLYYHSHIFLSYLTDIRFIYYMLISIFYAIILFIFKTYKFKIKT